MEPVDKAAQLILLLLTGTQAPVTAAEAGFSLSRTAPLIEELYRTTRIQPLLLTVVLVGL